MDSHTTTCASWVTSRTRASRRRSPCSALAALLLLVAAFSASAGASAATITLGPIQQLERPEAVTIAMELDAPTLVSVCCGTAPPWDTCYAADAPATRHELQVMPPEDGSAMSCLVVDEGGASLSAMFPVHGPPPAGTPWEFLVIGDTRTRADAHTSVIDAMAARDEARLYVHTGDFVEVGHDRAAWAEHFAVEAPLLRRMPGLAVIGNHDLDDLDHGDRGITAWREFLALPADAPAPEAYYGFTYGNVHFIVLDTYHSILSRRRCATERWRIYPFCFDTAQYAWLVAELEQASADPAVEHIVVLPHVGPYSSRVGRDGNAQLRALLPLFAEHGVTAIISGHDHYYERGWSWNGIPYIIAAGGGAPLYEIGPPNPAPHVVEINQSVEHYLQIEVDGPVMTFTARTVDGAVLDTFSVTSGDGYTRRASPPWVRPSLYASAALVVLVGGVWLLRRRRGRA